MSRYLLIFLMLALVAVGLRLAPTSQEARWSRSDIAVLLSAAPDPGDILDERWQPVDPAQIDAWEGSFWLRTFVRLKRDDYAYVSITGTGSYAVWWDGRLIGENGRLSPEGEELEIGRIERVFSLPVAHHGAGEHTLVMRVNADARGDEPLTGWISFLTQKEIPGRYLRDAAIGVIAAVFALISACIYVFFAVRHANYSQAFYVAFCLSFLALAGLEAWRSLLGYPYPWHAPRLMAVAVFTSLTGILLNLFLLSYFRAGRWVGLLPVLVAILAGTAWLMRGQYDAFGAVATMVSALFALGVCFLATLGRHRGAPVLLSALGGAFVIYLVNLEFADEWGVFALFLVVTSTVHLLLANDIRALDRSLALAELRSLRLREELYRRFLQPHFMLNTLTAISEWVVQAPDQAMNAIQGLAEEVRALTGMVDKDRVPLSEEIALCRKHCALMSERLNTRFQLEVDGDPQGSIPPAVLHTLVENVFTHNRYSASEVGLRLECRNGPGGRILRLISPIGDVAHSRPVDEGEGRGWSGLNYVRSRLAEAHGDAWHLDARAECECWVVEIGTPSEAGH